MHACGFPGCFVVKSSPANAGDPRDAGSIPGSGSSPGGGNENALQYFCQKNPIDRGDLWATVHGGAKSQTWQQLSMHACMCVGGSYIGYLYTFYSFCCETKATLKKLNLLKIISDMLKSEKSTIQLNRKFLPQIITKYKVVVVSHPVVPDSLWPHGLLHTRLLCPWSFPGKDTGVGCLSLSRGSSWPRDQAQGSRIESRFFTIWATIPSAKYMHTILLFELWNRGWNTWVSLARCWHSFWQNEAYTPTASFQGHVVEVREHMQTKLSIPCREKARTRKTERRRWK